MGLGWLLHFNVVGLNLLDTALLFNRVVLGLFFVLARFRWFYDPHHGWFSHIRLWSLRMKCEKCGFGNTFWIPALVAISEVFAGFALIAGFLTVFAAMGMLIVLLVASFCVTPEKTLRQNPVDQVDVASCYLWTPEPLYITMAIITILCGAGVYSVDFALLWWIAQ